MGNGALPAIIGCDHYFNFPSIGLSWLTVKVRVWVAELHTDQTVGSSVMKARVVTVSGVTWTISSLDLTDVPGGTMAQRRYPPAALIECVADIAQRHHKVRRLHLVIVDLWRPWKINQTQVRSLTGALRRLQYSADCTTPLSPQPGKTPLHGRRFVSGYSLDGSDFPCYLLWPVRTPTGSFCLLESQTQLRNLPTQESCYAPTL